MYAVPRRSQPLGVPPVRRRFRTGYPPVPHQYRTPSPPHGGNAADPAPPKGNGGETAAARTPRRDTASYGLIAVRRAARQSKSVRFTALLHHITIDLLKQSYLSLERDSAPAIDGVSRFSVGLVSCAGGEYCGVGHDRHLSAASILACLGAYGCAQAECWRRSRSDGI
jgi:hypothetical protein